MFYLIFHPTNASSLIPVYLCSSCGSILELDLRDTLSFPPSTFSVHPTQSCDFPYSVSSGKCSLMINFSNDLEIHWLHLMSA